MQKEVDVLNELITVSEDGQKGFTEATELATDARLKTLFTECASGCASAITELKALVLSLGEAANDEGSAAGTAHRAWLKVKASVEDANIAVLEEVERGQDHAKAAYAKALKGELRPGSRTVVEKQAAGAKLNHDRVRDLRNAYKAAA